jgi:hypothetical protein
MRKLIGSHPAILGCIAGGCQREDKQPNRTPSRMKLMARRMRAWCVLLVPPRFWLFITARCRPQPAQHASGAPSRLRFLRYVTVKLQNLMKVYLLAARIALSRRIFVKRRCANEAPEDGIADAPLEGPQRHLEASTSASIGSFRSMNLSVQRPDSKRSTSEANCRRRLAEAPPRGRMPRRMRAARWTESVPATPPGRGSRRSSCRLP